MARFPAPTFSASERDRRWAAVRQIMDRAQWNLDAILTTPSDSHGAYARYLTQIGGYGAGLEVIFPRDPATPVHAFLGRFRPYWESRLTDWCADGMLVLRGDDGSQAVALQLRALGLDAPGTRLGVGKLTGARFDPEGLVSTTYLENLRAAMPEALFVPIERWGVDLGPIEESAMLKGPEEHEAITHSVAAGEKGIEALVSAARPPAENRADLWFPTFVAMFAETGEHPTRLSIAFDQAADRTLALPVGDPFREGLIVNEEIGATVQGYQAQVNHSLFIGDRRTPGYRYYAAAMETAIDLFADALEFIVPGKTTCGQLADRYAARVEALSAEDASGVVLHSSGIGTLARPRLGPTNSRGDEDVVVAAGMAFDFKPAIRMKRSAVEDVVERNRIAQIGEHVLVTESGAVRLGTRDLAPIATLD